jgi:chromosome segregation ATPase
VDILNKYVKKIDFEANKLKNQITQLEKEIAALEKTKNQIQKEYLQVEARQLSNPQEIYMQKMYLLELKEKIAYIELEKKKRENDLIPLKEILAGKNAEKKAVKKYSDKKEKEFLKKELQKEIELASELFNRTGS